MGELDDWQVILWILGIANSGKSTLCKLVQIFYQDEDVAVISNNVEEQFGLMSVYDKLVFMAPEVKRDWRLNQAEFQSMVTGEKMSIARKFQAAAQDIFNVPGMIAGNDMPSWMDNSGSVVRRVILVMFNEVIRKVNGEISNMLRAEVAATILKSNQAYHVMLKNYGSSGIWENLPAYFTASQDKLKAKTHPVYDFLRSETLVFGEDLCVPMQRFRTEFMTHCKMNGLKREPWKEELYMVPLMEKKLEIKMVDELEWHGRIYKRVQFIYGVDIVENDTFNDAGGELSYTGGIDSAEKGHGHKQGGSAKKQRTMTGNQSHTSHSSHSVPKSKFTSFAEVPVLPPMVDF